MQRHYQERGHAACIGLSATACGISISAAIVFDSWFLVFIAVLFLGLAAISTLALYSAGPGVLGALGIFGRYAEDDNAAVAVVPPARLDLYYNTFDNNNNNETYDCCICLNCTEGKFVRLRCNHVYHEACINKWFGVKLVCPICQRVAVAVAAV